MNWNIPGNFWVAASFSRRRHYPLTGGKSINFEKLVPKLDLGTPYPAKHRLDTLLSYPVAQAFQPVP